jgi:hypothetical protein
MTPPPRKPSSPRPKPAPPQPPQVTHPPVQKIPEKTVGASSLLRSREMELAVRAAGAVIGVWAGALLALYATFWTPMRVGQALVPVSILLAVGGNAALIWFAYSTTRNKFLGLLPGIVSVAVSFLGAERTTEGDLILFQTNWVATVYLLAGAGTVAVAGYKLIVPKPSPLYQRGGRS